VEQGGAGVERRWYWAGKTLGPGTGGG
jgi:hypothetical protein